MAIRIGVVGVGFGTTVHIPAFQSEGLEVVAVCSRRQERAEEAAHRFGIPKTFTAWEDLVRFDGVDAISVATPVSLHRPVVLGALAAGKHVICEKPFGVDAAEAEQMWRAATSSGCTAMIAHEFRFASARMRVSELLGEGYIGSLRLALLRLVRGGFAPPGALTSAAAPSAPPEYVAARDAAASGAGFLFALGSHYIDCLRHWFGEVATVSADLVTFASERTGTSGVVLADADDTFLFTFEFVDGGYAQMVGTRAAPFGDGSSIEIYGSAGTLVTPQEGFNPPAHGTLLGARLGEPALADLEIPERLAPFADDRDDRLMPFRRFTREFIRGIEEGTSPGPSFHDGLRCQQLLDAARESSATGHKVTLPKG